MVMDGRSRQVPTSSYARSAQTTRKVKAEPGEATESSFAKTSWCQTEKAALLVSCPSASSASLAQQPAPRVVCFAWAAIQAAGQRSRSLVPRLLVFYRIRTLQLSLIALAFEGGNYRPRQLYAESRQSTRLDSLHMAERFAASASMECFRVAIPIDSRVGIGRRRL